MKAMILAAGRGERMRHLTDHCPKPMLAAAGRPLIEHTLLALLAAGYKDFVINVAYRGQQIRDYLGDGSRYQANIVYSDEGEQALETAGGICMALPLLGSEPFLLVNGDIGSDYPYARLRKHTPSGMAHLLLAPNPPHHPEGDFALHDGQIGNTSPGSLRHTYCGIGVYRPALFAALEPGQRAALGPLLRKAAELGQVSGELHAGFWMDIGTPERLDAYACHLADMQKTPR
ncbi:MAG: hypothetical protein RIQ52_1921 [Pseudomonadota bacterium]